MQLRELLKTQQLLNPLVSAKNTSQTVEWDAFSQLLAQKNTQTQTRDVQPQTPIEPKQKLAINAPTERKFSVKVGTTQSQASNASIERSATKETTKESDPIDKVKPTEKDSKPEASDQTDSTGKLKDKLKNALKAKLKGETGLDDQQIDAMLSTLNLDVDALTKLLENGEAAVTLFTELASVLETLEIDIALDQNLSTKDVNQVVKQIDKLIDSLSKLQNMSSETKLSDVATSENDGKAFESKLIQSLSQISATLKNAEADTNVKPEAIRKSIVEALMMQSSVGALQDKSALASEDKSVDGVVETIVPTTSATASQSNPSSTSDKQSQNPNQAELQTANLTNTATTNAQVTQTGTSENVSQNTVATEAEVTAVEDNKGISAHQMVMKQSNAMTSPTILPSGQVKQEIFTQIIDAIKGQIKLSDHGTSLIVKLQPEQLGNVELKLNIQKGIVLAEIKVENEIVKAAIESNLDDLKQSLSNKGYSVDQINVSVDSGKKDQQQAFEFNGQERKNKQTQKPDEVSVGEVVETVNRYVVDEYEGSTINYYG